MSNCLVLLDQNSANFQMLAKTTVLQLNKQNFIEMITHFLLFLKSNFCWGGITRFNRGTSGKIGPKVEICQTSQLLQEKFTPVCPCSPTVRNSCQQKMMKLGVLNLNISLQP